MPRGVIGGHTIGHVQAHPTLLGAAEEAARPWAVLEALLRLDLEMRPLLPQAAGLDRVTPLPSPDLPLGPLGGHARGH